MDRKVFSTAEIYVWTEHLNAEPTTRSLLQINGADIYLGGQIVEVDLAREEVTLQIQVIYLIIVGTIEHVKAISGGGFYITVKEADIRLYGEMEWSK